MFDLRAKARTPGFDHQYALLSGGTFTNVLEQNITIQGQKLWKNLPAHFDEIHLPTIRINVWQKVKDDTADPILVASLKKSDWVTGTEKYKFTITEQTNGQPLPKYDAEGRIYEYTIQEEVYIQNADGTETLLGTSDHGAIPQEGDLYQATCVNFALENDYRHLYGETITGTASVAIPDGANLVTHPGFTFTLTRSYQDSAGNPVQETGYRTKYVWQSDAVKTALQTGSPVTLDAASLRFDKLEKLAPNGTPYLYTLTLDQTQLGGYAVTVTGDTQDIPVTDPTQMPQISFSIQKTDPETVTLTARKEWIGLDGQHNSDAWLGNRPESITVTLYRSAANQTGQTNAVPSQVCVNAEGTPVTAVLNAANGWTANFENLEKYAPNGMPWKYKIIENDQDGKHTAPAGYRVSDTDAQVTANASGDTGLTMTLVNTAIPASIGFEKVWQDQDGPITADHLGFEVTVQFSPQVRFRGETEWKPWQDFFTGEGPQEAPVKSVTGRILSQDTWKGTFAALPSYYQGKKVEYQVKETAITRDGSDISSLFTAAYASSASKTIITNTIPTLTYTITHKWEGDSSNAYKTRPESVSFILQRSSGSGWTEVTSAGVITLKTGAAAVQTHSVAYLPKYAPDENGQLLPYSYRAVQVVNGADGWMPLEEDAIFHTTYTVQYEAEDTGTVVTDLMPETLTQDLSVEKRWSPGSEKQDITFTLTGTSKDLPARAMTKAADVWTATWENIPIHHPYATGDYGIQESPLTGYTTQIQPGTDTTWVVTNTQLVNVRVTKAWEGDTTVYLYSDQGYTGQSLELTSGKQTDVFQNLPMYDAGGRQIPYVVREQVDGQILTYETTLDDRYTFTVHYEDSTVPKVEEGIGTLETRIRHVDKTAVAVVQNWDDFSNLHQTRPDSVAVWLHAGQTPVRQLSVPGTGNRWTLDAAGLPAVDEKGMPIVYSVSMEEVSGYETAHADGSFEFTHTLIRLQDIPVSCSWTDNDNAFHTRPDDLTIALWANGAMVRSAKISSNTGWKTLFEDVPIYETDGTIITYTLQAYSAAGYSVTLTPEGNGFLLHYVGSGALTVSKTVEGNLGEKDRQFHFTVALSDSTVTGTYGGMTFTAGTAAFTLKHGQSITATGLPAEVRYTVTETEANRYGYTTKSEGASGSIEAGKTAAACFVNRRNDPSLPQTGQLNWPIPVLLGGGILLFAFGRILKRKKRR